MSDEFNKTKHTVFISNREMLEVSGINEVASFNEEEISAQGDWGDLLIKGSHLYVEVLDLALGTLKVSGEITALVYSHHTPKRGIVKRLFS